MNKLVLIALFSLGATALFSQQAITDAEVANAADTLLKSPKDAKAWQTFQSVIRADTYAPEIRSRAMFFFAASNLLQMNTNRFVSALQTLQAQYPEESAALSKRVTAEDWLVPCPECGGTGVRKNAARCLNCGGTGKIVQLSPRVKEQVLAVLGEIKAFATENIQFGEASRTALAENNPPRRLAALQELVGKYAHRKDLAAAKQALAKTEADIAKADALARQRKAEQELREQEDKDFQKISAALDTLPESAIPVMIKEIDRFVDNYPKSANRLELEIAKTKLQQRETIHDYVRLGLYASLGLAAFALLVSFVKGLFVQKKKPAGPLPLPGLTKTSEETDPLAGTFTDDQDRP